MAAGIAGAGGRRSSFGRAQHKLIHRRAMPQRYRRARHARDTVSAVHKVTGADNAPGLAAAENGDFSIRALQNAGDGPSRRGGQVARAAGAGGRPAGWAHGGAEKPHGVGSAARQGRDLATMAETGMRGKLRPALLPNPAWRLASLAAPAAFAGSAGAAGSAEACLVRHGKVLGST